MDNSQRGMSGWSSPSRGADTKLVRQAIDRAQRGDYSGQRFLYVRFAPEVFRYVSAIVDDHHEAEDITHNVFAKLLSNIGLYESREAQFGTWILRVARNASLDHLRSRRPVPTADLRLEQREESRGPGGSVLRTALRELPDEQREVLVLRHIVGLSPPEIASVLGRTESSVHGLHNRGRRSLKKNLAEQGAAPAVVVSSGALTR